jgi:hypothetical protein
MTDNIRSILVLTLLSITAPGQAAAETLRDTLQAADVPTQDFSDATMDEKITSYAISTAEPFLLAYYTDDGSGLLKPPLHLVRFLRGTNELRKAALQNATAEFEAGVDIDCLGSALSIFENVGTIYVETHISPSAGCVLVLSPTLEFRQGLSGWLLGLMGSDYAIMRRSETHTNSPTPMRIAMFDLKQKQLADVYPFKNDVQRLRFSRLIKRYISKSWCREYVLDCDPNTFDTEVKGALVVNAAAKTFGFEAEFDAAGFSATSEIQVPSRVVGYVYRRHGAIWEHRELEPGQLQDLYGIATIKELVTTKPNAAFEANSQSPKKP